MKKNCTILILVALFLSHISCTEDNPAPIPGHINVDLKSEQIIDADNQFGLELFQLINQEVEGNKNLMISPLSVSLALTMAYNGAENSTREQMEAVLHKLGMTPDEINQSYQYLVNALESHDPKVELSIANAIFYNNQFDVKSDFTTTNQKYFDAEVEALNFSNSSATLNRVNGWVQTKTHDKIESIIEHVSPLDVLYLINAIYFNGEWTYRFEEKETANRSFFLENGSEIQVPTMEIEEEFRYLNEEKFQLLEMPYGSGKFSMLIFLPHENISTNDIITQLSPANLESWLVNMNGGKRKVFFPKFEFSFENSLNDNLKALGMINAFDPNLSNFSGISDATDLYISDVKHKSFIKVDERGTEAAAVTGITIGTTSVQPGAVFTVDHPFVFAIREKDTDAILFVGKVTNPLITE